MRKSQSNEWFDNKRPEKKEEFTEESRQRAMMRFAWVYSRMLKK